MIIILMMMSMTITPAGGSGTGQVPALQRGVRDSVRSQSTNSAALVSTTGPLVYIPHIVQVWSVLRDHS